MASDMVLRWPGASIDLKRNVRCNRDALIDSKFAIAAAVGRTGPSPALIIPAAHPEFLDPIDEWPVALGNSLLI